MTSIILYGPQGSGKTVNSQAIMRHYGCKSIKEKDGIGRPDCYHIMARDKAEFANGNTLYITCEEPPAGLTDSRRIIHIKDALAAIGK